MAEALALRHVSAGYGETVVLEDINLVMAPGESISVIGRNTQGVRIMNLNEGDKIASIAKVAQENTEPNGETATAPETPLAE